MSIESCNATLDKLKTVNLLATANEIGNLYSWYLIFSIVCLYPVIKMVYLAKKIFDKYFLYVETTVIGFMHMIFHFRLLHSSENLPTSIYFVNMSLSMDLEIKVANFKELMNKCYFKDAINNYFIKCPDKNINGDICKDTIEKIRKGLFRSYDDILSHVNTNGFLVLQSRNYFIVFKSATSFQYNKYVLPFLNKFYENIKNDNNSIIKLRSNGVMLVDIDEDIAYSCIYEVLNLKDVNYDIQIDNFQYLEKKLSTAMPRHYGHHEFELDVFSYFYLNQTTFKLELDINEIVDYVYDTSTATDDDILIKDPDLDSEIIDQNLVSNNNYNFLDTISELEGNTGFRSLLSYSIANSHNITDIEKKLENIVTVIRQKKLETKVLEMFKINTRKELLDKTKKAIESKIKSGYNPVAIRTANFVTIFDNGELARHYKLIKKHCFLKSLINAGVSRQDLYTSIFKTFGMDVSTKILRDGLISYSQFTQLLCVIVKSKPFSFFIFVNNMISKDIINPSDLLSGRVYLNELTEYIKHNRVIHGTMIGSTENPIIFMIRENDILQVHPTHLKKRTLVNVDFNLKIEIHGF